MKLRDACRVLLDDWRRDLEAQWRSVLDGVEPDLNAIDGALDLRPGELIFPGRKGKAPPGARTDSHIFRALEAIAPGDVRVVIMGQDPYQRVTQATGRSFEQGDLRDWFGKPSVAPSLRRIIQSLAAIRTGEKRYAQDAAGWKWVVDGIRAQQLTIPAPLPLWDHWQSEGALFINAIFTFTRAESAHQFDGHGRLWAPVVRRLLEYIVRRPKEPVVFVAWGGKAETAFAASGAQEAAQEAGTWGKTVVLVRRPHPNARANTNGPGGDVPFLRGSNPFKQIDDALDQIGGNKIRW